MEIETSRFGSVDIESDDVIRFPSGLVGFEELHDWVLLADAHNAALGWLQSTTRAEVAMAVVSPRRFVPEYRFRVNRSELTPLEIDGTANAQVVVIVSKNERAITLNLKAPVLINLERRLGRQVIANGEQPLQHELAAEPEQLKKSA